MLSMPAEESLSNHGIKLSHGSFLHRFRLLQLIGSSLERELLPPRIGVIGLLCANSQRISVSGFSAISPRRTYPRSRIAGSVKRYQIVRSTLSWRFCRRLFASKDSGRVFRQMGVS